MRGLNDVGIIQALNEFVLSGKPFLGICLGMQMILEYSEEFGFHKGLGYISGVVKEIPRDSSSKHARKIPHIGWSAVLYPTTDHEWNNSILSGFAEGDYFYFLHSFMAVPQNELNLLAQCEYEGIRITAAIQKENITGLQFHPEKSGNSGLRILKRFVCD
jgi:glutamine amidotransferase